MAGITLRVDADGSVHVRHVNKTEWQRVGDTGAVDGRLVSGGYFQQHWFPTTCRVCGREGGSEGFVTACGASGLCYQCCWNCAGFGWPEGFKARESWIREAAPNYSGMPTNVLADWCEDNGRSADADYLRASRSGR